MIRDIIISLSVIIPSARDRVVEVCRTLFQDRVQGSEQPLEAPPVQSDALHILAKNPQARVAELITTLGAT